MWQSSIHLIHSPGFWAQRILQYSHCEDRKFVLGWMESPYTNHIPIQTSLFHTNDLNVNAVNLKMYALNWNIFTKPSHIPFNVCLIFSVLADNGSNLCRRFQPMLLCSFPSLEACDSCELKKINSLLWCTMGWAPWWNWKVFSWTVGGFSTGFLPQGTNSLPRTTGKSTGHIWGGGGLKISNS